MEFPFYHRRDLGGGVSSFSPHFVRKHVGREARPAVSYAVSVTALQARGPRRKIEMKTIGYLRKGHGGNSRTQNWHKTPPTE